MNKETIRIIIELFISWNGETDVINIANLDSAVDYIFECLFKEHISESLEEMADKYSKTPAINNPPFAPTEFIKEAFKVGAQWQKQQTVEKAVEWLNSKQRGFILTEKDIEDFKRYMEK